MSEEDVLSKINTLLYRRFRKNAPQLIKASQLPAIEWVSTGMLGYDWVNGGGGPKGKVEQIYGRRSSGKTTLLLRRIAEAQRLGLRCAFIDVEHELVKDWAKKLGVDLNKLFIHEPDYEPAEVTLGVIEELIASGEFGLICIDSIPALGTEAMLSKDMGDRHYAGIAGLMETFYKRVIGTGLLYNSNCILIFVNQPRDLIGSKIPLERLPGGRALQHMSAIITETRVGDYITSGSGDEEEKIGVEIKVINKKNKVRWPFREQTLRLQFGNGFNPLWDVLQFATRYNLIEYNGSWGYYKGEQLGQGQNQIMKYLIDNAEIYYELKGKIIELIKLGR